MAQVFDDGSYNIIKAKEIYNNRTEQLLAKVSQELNPNVVIEKLIRMGFLNKEELKTLAAKGLIYGENQQSHELNQKREGNKKEISQMTQENNGKQEIEEDEMEL